jgi:hypothetical protein
LWFPPAQWLREYRLVWLHHDVVVEDRDELLAGRGEADVEGLARAVSVVRHHDQAHVGELAGDHLDRAVRAGVVHDDDLGEGAGLRP